MQNRDPGALCLHERLFTVAAKPNDRFRPCGRIVGLASGISPQNCAGLVGKLPRKCPIDPHKSISNELLYSRIAERAHRFVFTAKSSHHLRVLSAEDGKPLHLDPSVEDLAEDLGAAWAGTGPFGCSLRPGVEGRRERLEPRMVQIRPQ
jgi:hypothetical protein